VNEIVNDSDSDREGCYTHYHTVKHYWRYVLNFKSLSHIVFVYFLLKSRKKGLWTL